MTLDVPVSVWVPPPNSSSAPVASKEPEEVPPPDRSSRPLCTSTVPALLKATLPASWVVPTPGDLMKVPSLSMWGEPPFQRKISSFWTVKVAPAWLSSQPPVTR